MDKFITPDPISLTALHLHAVVLETETVLAAASGFIYRRRGKSFLVTNWHNVTGRNPVTGRSVSSSGAFPSGFSTQFRLKGARVGLQRETLAIYNDALLLEPRWLEHPVFGRKVDVVVIPLDQGLDRYHLPAVNECDFDDQFKLDVADEAFVIGYPFQEPTLLSFPIWKKASIASEPSLDIDGLPKILIDTATRPGLSGSAVVMQRIGIHGFTDGKPQADSMIGRIRKFMGVYSGRIGEDETKAQLGIVWKASVIDEIIDGQQTGKPWSDAV